MRNIKSVIKVSSITLAVLFVASYSLYEARNLIRGPILEIQYPADGSSVNTSLVEIKGIVQNVSAITLNDRHITVDNKGLFKEKILLSPGYNIITLSAADKFGRSTKQELNLVLTEHETLVLSASPEEIH